jgi:hypothetical protein
LQNVSYRSQIRLRQPQEYSIIDSNLKGTMKVSSTSRRHGIDTDSRPYFRADTNNDKRQIATETPIRIVTHIISAYQLTKQTTHRAGLFSFFQMFYSGGPYLT